MWRSDVKLPCLCRWPPESREPRSPKGSAGRASKVAAGVHRRYTASPRGALPPRTSWPALHSQLRQAAPERRRLWHLVMLSTPEDAWPACCCLPCRCCSLWGAWSVLPCTTKHCLTKAKHASISYVFPHGAVEQSWILQQKALRPLGLCALMRKLLQRPDPQLQCSSENPGVTAFASSSCQDFK